MLLYILRTNGLMVKWIIRSVNYDNEGELYKVVKDAIDSGNIDGLTPQLEHFTFVRLDSKYSILRHDYIYIYIYIYIYT